MDLFEHIADMVAFHSASEAVKKAVDASPFSGLTEAEMIQLAENVAPAKVQKFREQQLEKMRQDAADAQRAAAQRIHDEDRYARRFSGLGSLAGTGAGLARYLATGRRPLLNILGGNVLGGMAGAGIYHADRALYDSSQPPVVNTPRPLTDAVKKAADAAISMKLIKKSSISTALATSFGRRLAKADQPTKDVVETETGNAQQDMDAEKRLKKLHTAELRYRDRLAGGIGLAAGGGLGLARYLATREKPIANITIGMGLGGLAGLTAHKAMGPEFGIPPYRPYLGRPPSTSSEKTAADSATAEKSEETPEKKIPSLGRFAGIGAGIGGGLGLAKSLATGGSPVANTLTGAALGGIGGTATHRVIDGQPWIPQRTFKPKPREWSEAVNTEAPARAKLQLLGINPDVVDPVAKDMATGKITEEEGKEKLRENRPNVANRALEAIPSAVDEFSKGHVGGGLNQLDVLGIKNLNPAAYNDPRDVIAQGWLPSAVGYAAGKRIANGPGAVSSALTSALESGGRVGRTLAKPFHILDAAALKKRLEQIPDSHRLAEDDLAMILGRSETPASPEKPTWKGVRLGKHQLSPEEVRKAFSHVNKYNHEGDQRSRFRRVTGGPLPILGAVAPLVASEWLSPNGYRSGNADLKSLAEAHRHAINGGGAVASSSGINTSTSSGGKANVTSGDPRLKVEKTSLRDQFTDKEGTIGIQDGKFYIIHEGRRIPLPISERKTEK